MKLTRILRLPVNAGLPAMIAKNRRRNLPAGIAIDAAGVHVEFAFDVLWQAVVNLGHAYLDSVLAWKVACPGHAIRVRWLDAEMPYNPWRLTERRCLCLFPAR